jgi:protein N-lysine methyltransferase METTL21A
MPSLTSTVPDRGEPLPPNMPNPELILAADCVYLENTFPLLVQTLSDASETSTEILFCYQKRRKADRRFFALLKKIFSWTEASFPFPLSVPCFLTGSHRF